MATANVTVKIEGLEALEAFVTRLEELIAQTEKLGRLDHDRLSEALNRTARLGGVE